MHNVADFKLQVTRVVALLSRTINSASHNRLTIEGLRIEYNGIMFNSDKYNRTKNNDFEIKFASFLRIQLKRSSRSASISSPRFTDSIGMIVQVDFDFVFEIYGLVLDFGSHLGFGSRFGFGHCVEVVVFKMLNERFVAPVGSPN